MENLSKIVLTCDGKRVGYVLDVAIDFENMKKLGYYVVDEESEGEFLLRSENVISTSCDYVLIESVRALEFVAERKSVFGKEILDENCQSYGRLQKIIFNGKRCEKFVTDKCEIPSKFVDKIGENVIFVKFKRKKSKKSQRTFPRIEIDDKVEIQNVPSVIMPEKIALSSSFYVGKVSSENIVGFNNEKIVSKGEVVTKAIFEKAKKHNRLNHLFFALKR